MVVSVTGPRVVNELGGPVIPGSVFHVAVPAGEVTSSRPNNNNSEV